MPLDTHFRNTQTEREINMYECFHCGKKAVVWTADFDGDDYGYGKNSGIIHECHCTNCGAQITYFVPNKPEDLNMEDDGK